MPPEAANEPLEPGSGAPDVKKILERVRASQNAARTNPKPASEGDRADYIAAARRAAQAAAVEVDAGGKAGAVKGEKKGKIKDPAKGGSAFSRFRRPILLAVGAVLLAIMAFPLARTVTSGRACASRSGDAFRCTEQRSAARQRNRARAGMPSAPVAAAPETAAPDSGSNVPPATVDAARPPRRRSLPRPSA
jgi:localization factor PodJL